MSSFPPLTGERKIMHGIPGSPPNLANPPSGCRFHPRCPHCTQEDEALYTAQTTVRPRLQDIESGHLVACHLYADQFRAQHGDDVGGKAGERLAAAASRSPKPQAAEPVGGRES